MATGEVGVVLGHTQLQQGQDDGGGEVMLGHLAHRSCQGA